MGELNNEVEIDASAERVWQLLTDFATYPQWNPYIQGITGNLTTGNRLTVTLQPTRGRRTTVRPTVLNVEDSHELRWVDRIVLPGVRDVEHVFQIDRLGPERVRFTQREICTGVLASFHMPSSSAGTRQGFREMGRALKMRAEQARSRD
jgi:hypothetical protein